MDFYRIMERSTKNGVLEVYPAFTVCRSSDLMVRGKGFYAIWDAAKGLWSTDEYDVQRLVDEELRAHGEEAAKRTDGKVHVRYMSDFTTKSWKEFRDYMAHISDNSHQIDAKLTFADTVVKKHDYVSKRLPYPLEKGPCTAYDEIISTLYDPDERAKLEWAIGSVVTGDAKTIQKFIVLFGEAGTGKSTILNIIQKLFDGYVVAFEAKSLTSNNNAFSTEVFRSNPLVAIDHDGDLSRIEDNTRLNMIVGHDMMTMNEKYKPAYSTRANCLLFMGSNKPVKITDAKSGVIRRLIDVRPTGKTIPTARYFDLMSRVDFELGAIAYHCQEVYKKMGKNYYSAYRPLDMIFRTDVFFNFVEDNYFLFSEQGGISLAQAYAIYKEYCDKANVENKLAMYKFREELKNYFTNFSTTARVDGKQIRSYFSGFRKEKFTSGEPNVQDNSHATWITMDSPGSLFDEQHNSCLAQYSKEGGIPEDYWANVHTHLSDIDTTREHYVKLPPNEIVIDFDLKDDKGNKSAELNLAAAAKWPPTYAEYSRSGTAIHLHYNYEGDTSKLSPLYSEGIEVKVFTGNSALRRRVTKCNTYPIATINTGLPLKEEKPKVINADVVKSEKGLRDLIGRNLAKEIHPATRPSMDFIKKILDEAYDSGMHYDVSDLRPKILDFALRSTHQSDYCLKLMPKIHFQSDEPSADTGVYQDDTEAYFDVEVFPNLFVVCWKFKGKENECVSLINPKPSEIEELFKLKLIGFNNRKYDNHILYAAWLGYDNEQIYETSFRIVNGSKNAFFREAYNISFMDIYEVSSKKQSLKRFQIELGIHHQELGLPFDQPVPEEKWGLVVEYCCNDVISTEAVCEDRKEDITAHRILAELSGLTMNDTANQHTAKILFGDDPKPQEKFVYTNLEEIFPGYRFEFGKSSYRGEDPGEGGYVYAEPGAYTDVALLDVASMHPTSIELLNLFGDYTKTYSEIKSARIAIKRKDYDKAGGMLKGVLARYLTNPEDSGALAYALKIALNKVYGLTSAKFDNKFRDPRNVDNIVAKRGALFMIDLKNAVQSRGYKVAHIKTDSIKIPNADKDIIDFVFEFGKKYGYEFEHEATYDRFCLVNDAVYIARYKDGKHAGEWTVTGAEFAHPYIFKTLFSKEPIVFEDLCETKTVTSPSAMYLDMNEGLGDDQHNYCFVGRAGSFCPIQAGRGGGVLLREKDGKYSAVTGTKGVRWLEAELVRQLGKEDDIDYQYYDRLVTDAVKHISKFCSFDEFMA